jgi:hypothetical protein
MNENFTQFKDAVVQLLSEAHHKYSENPTPSTLAYIKFHELLCKVLKLVEQDIITEDEGRIIVSGLQLGTSTIAMNLNMINMAVIAFAAMYDRLSINPNDQPKE